MFNPKQCDRYPKHFEWLVRLNLSFVKSEKPEYFRTVIKDRGSSKYRWDLLDSVKLPKSDKMIIMPMGPDYSINMRGIGQEKLLPKIW
jgi:hypothetical protein